ncbi:MAG: hypothetical protein J0653_00305, partial [Deltaproteobacteria bacterium]|nr:hypothetical protein [Deltaproteobacteria bacterium]
AVLRATTHSAAQKRDAEPQIRAGRVLKMPYRGNDLKINNRNVITHPQKEEIATTDQISEGILPPPLKKAAKFQLPDHQYCFPNYLL